MLIPPATSVLGQKSSLSLFPLGVTPSTIMPTIPAAALLLAGFALAHATWSVSDTQPDELLVPLAVIEAEAGQRSLQRFEADTQEQAIAAGQAAAAEFTHTALAWAFAREGAVRTSAGPVDVISVDCWTRGMTAPVTLVQPFARASKEGPFRLLGPPLLSVGGRQLEATAAQPHLATVMEGVRSHPKAAPLWRTWQ